MEIKTNRLVIRFIQPEDWESLLEIWMDFSRSEYARYDVPHPCDERTAREKAVKWSETGGDHLYFAVCLEGQMIGYVSSHRCGDGFECGYCFNSTMHGRGYARESIQAILRYLHDVWGVRRCTAGTGLLNIPSVRLLEALGFQKTGEEKVSFYQDESGHPIVFDGGVFEMLL